MNQKTLNQSHIDATDFNLVVEAVNIEEAWPNWLNACNFQTFEAIVFMLIDSSLLNNITQEIENLYQPLQPLNYCLFPMKLLPHNNF